MLRLRRHTNAGTPFLAAQFASIARSILEQETECCGRLASISSGLREAIELLFSPQPIEEFTMSKEDDNKAIVGRWFTDFWGKTCNLDIVDELAAPDMLLQYSLHEPRRGRDDIKAFMTGFPRSVSRPQLLGRRGPHRRGRLRRRPLGRRRHAYRPGFQRFPRRIAAGGDGPQDAFHRHDRAAARRMARSSRRSAWTTA